MRGVRRSAWRLGSWLLFAVLSLTAIGFELAYVAQAVRWTSEPIRGWSYNIGGDPGIVSEAFPEARAAGLRPGDRIRRINGRTFETFAELESLLDLEIGHANLYEVERGGRTYEIELVTRASGVGNVLKKCAPFLAAGVVFIAMGILVFLMKPHDPASWAFVLLVFPAGVLLPNQILGPSFEPAWLEGVFIPAYYLTAAALLVLSVRFPVRRSLPVSPTLLMGVLYAVAIGLAAYELHEHAGEYRNRGPAYTLRMGIFVGAVVVFLLSCLQTRLRGASAAVRLQALVVFTGILLTAFVPASDQLYTVIVGDRLVPIAAVPIFFAALPVAIGYAIVQHDLFEVDTIVRRTYGYLLSTAAVVGLYAFTVSGLNVAAGPSGPTRSPLFTVTFVLAMLFVMQPIHGRLQRLVDRAFYRQKYSYRETITNLTERITSLLDPRAVRETLVRSVVGEMFLENGMLLAASGDTGSLELQVDVGKAWPAGRPGEVQLPGPVTRTISQRRGPLFRHEIELDPAFEEHRVEMEASFDGLEAEMMLPMFYQEQLRAVLSLGRKKSGKMYTREDVDLLRTLAGEASIALENSRLFKELADSLKQVQMLETVKSNLAKFVPETVKSMVEGAEDAEDVFQKRDVDLSVMFADMTGYTRLSARLPIDEVNDIIERYFGAFLDEILRHGGDINETAGDGLMVLFQDEDPGRHARAAASAALGIQHITRVINAERAAEGGDPVGMHIGINSGTASVGATKIAGGAGLRWTYTASGPVTNIAARVGAIGEEIAITPETRKRLGEAFAVEEVGRKTLKNVPEPLMVYRVVGGAEDAAVGPAPDLESGAAHERTWEETRALHEGRFAIRGVLRSAEDGAPLAGLRIFAFDKDMVRDDYLGEATSAPDGRFEIAFTDEFFGDLFEKRPDLYLLVKDAEGEREIHHTRDSVRWNAQAIEHYELRIPRSHLDGPSPDDP
jgi:class 3 adenylate cyclase/GAF domain-containing protein